VYKILIADDEPNLLDGIKAFVDWDALNSKVVYAATNGKSVIEYIKKNPVDILVTDLKMPGIGGVELARWIYENKIQTKVIFLSAYSDFKYVREALEFEIAAYILKDNYIDELEQTIKKVISKYFNKNDTLVKCVNKFIMNRATEEDKLEFDTVWEEKDFLCMLIKVVDEAAFGTGEIITHIIENAFAGCNIIIDDLSRFEYLCLVPGTCYDLSDRGKKVIQETEKEYGYKCKIGVSTKRDDVFLLNKSIQEAHDAISNINESGFLYYNDVQSNNLVKNACTIIERDYKMSLSLSTIANELNIAPSYLSRKFSSEQGCTVTEYINKIRMEIAIELMRNTDMLVYEIAEKVGIGDTAYFSNLFKRYTGTSPQKFKKNEKEN